MQGVNLNQPAKALWWANDDLPRNGELKWGGSDRQFGTLRDAINFVLTKLSPSELTTVLILFDSDPGSLNFAEAEVREQVKQWIREA
jgi:hypothetical protein